MSSSPSLFSNMQQKLAKDLTPVSKMLQEGFTENNSNGFFGSVSGHELKLPRTQQVETTPSPQITSS